MDADTLIGLVAPGLATGPGGLALLPVGLAFAAGAMLYVVVDELIPGALGRGNERIASLGFLIGFSVMMGSDRERAQPRSRGRDPTSASVWGP